jgi:putative tryptophan/tyrosine transport system substrate-binding protein
VRRRELIALVGGVAFSWPLAVRAQQAAMPVMGFLDASTLAQTADFLIAFRQGLLEEGFVEGRNVKVEYRWGENQNERLPALATDLAQRRVTVIFAGNLPSALAAQRATKTIPIVFGVGGDPVALGLVASLNRPGGNITGITLQSIEAYAKRVELLHELVPEARSIAFLTNPTSKRNAEDETREAQRAGGMLGLSILRLDASSPSDVEAAFMSLARERAGALLVSADPFFVVQRHQLIALTARHTIPAAYARREFAADGGLMTYGASLPYAYHVMGAYSGKILKGAKPADLPVVQPTRFELAINLKTAKALGLTIPPSLLARADEVIE